MDYSLGISDFLEEISSLSHSIVFLYFLHWSLRKAFLSLLAILWNSIFICLYLSFSPLLLASLFLASQLFLTPLQTTIFAICISFSWEWFWSQPPVQYYKPLSLVLQALCLSDLIPWIYLSLLLYNCKRFYLGHTWMVYFFPYFLQFKSEFGNKEFMIWGTVHSQSFWLTV